MSILVTGGAGFIGSHVCKALLDQGKEVICVDNLNDYYNPERKKKNIVSLDGNFTFYKKDICNHQDLAIIFKNHKIDQVIHLAARAGVRPSIEQPMLYQETNILGTTNLLELSKRYGVKQFVFASSSSVYGEQKKTPFSESDQVDKPISPYAASKKAGELLCYVYAKNTAMNVICLRFFTVYGPRGRPDMAVYLFTDRISKGRSITMFGKGDSRRDYTYIADIVSGVIASLDLDKKYEIINLGNSHPIELRKLIATIEEVVGKKAKINKKPMPEGDVPVTFADISKAKELLDYDPKTPLDEGLKNFYSWYTKN